jgi:hypothetical protein
MKPNEIKVLLSVLCPHCQKALLAEVTQVTPAITGLFTSEEMLLAKEDAEDRIEALNISQEKRSEALAWIKKAETIFTPNDVDTIIKNITDAET